MATIPCPHCQRVIPLVLAKDGVCPNCLADIRPPSLVSPPPIVAAPKIILSKTYVKPNRINQRSRNLPITVTVIAVCGVLLIAAIGFALRKTTTSPTRNQTTSAFSSLSPSRQSTTSQFETNLLEYLALAFHDEWESELPIVSIIHRERLDQPPTVVRGRSWDYWKFDCMVTQSSRLLPERRSQTLCISGNDISDSGMLWLGGMAEQYDNDAPRRKKQAEYDAKYRETEILESQRFMSDPDYRNANMNVPIGELIERQIGPRP